MNQGGKIKGSFDSSINKYSEVLKIIPRPPITCGRTGLPDTIFNEN